MNERTNERTISTNERTNELTNGNETDIMVQKHTKNIITAHVRVSRPSPALRIRILPRGLLPLSRHDDRSGCGPARRPSPPVTRDGGGDQHDGGGVDAVAGTNTGRRFDGRVGQSDQGGEDDYDDDDEFDGDDAG